MVRAAAVALLFLTSILPSNAAELPPLTGRVVDNAGLINDASEIALTARLAAFEDKSSDQIVVATIRTLDGDGLEDFANRLFRAWGLGQAGEDNGVLLLVVSEDRKMRIEVGYGLEGTLTDLHSKLIIENTMVPAFRAGDFAGGIGRAVDDIILVLEGNAAELEERAERARESEGAIDPFVVGFFILWFSIFFGSIFLTVIIPRFGRKVGKNRYKWMGVEVTVGGSSGSSSGYTSSSSSSSSWSSGGSSFSGGGGSSGGGGASGSW